MKIIIQTIKNIITDQRFLIFLFFSILALSAMTPIVSNAYLPTGDYHSHLRHIFQAKYAIKQLQFPIRVAPEMRHGWQYPLFQFYSPLPYQVAGTLAAPFGGATAGWVIFKALFWLTIFLAGVYSYRLLKLLSGSTPLGLIAGVVYVLSPYYLINIDVRGDFTETIAQGFVPVALFYVIRLFLEKRFNLKLFIVSSVLWYVLATSHLITFAYTFLFIFALLFLALLKNKEFIKAYQYAVLSGILGLLLAAWFLAPVGLTNNLHIYKELYDPSIFNFLTPLSELFSLSSISPIPLPGNYALSTQLYPSLGLPVVMGIGIAIYRFSQRENKINLFFEQLMPLLLLMFFLVFFLTWSPINFWKFIPRILNFAQFSYRFLTQCMWIGMLIFCGSLFWLFDRNINIRHVVVSIALIAALNHGWMYTQKSTMPSGTGSIEHYSDGNDYSLYDYSETTELVPINTFIGLNELPLVTGDQWLRLNIPYVLPNQLIKSDNQNLELIVTGKAPNARQGGFKHRIKLFALINDKTIADKTVTLGKMFTWTIPLKNLSIAHSNEQYALSFKASKTFLQPSKFDPSHDGSLLAVDSAKVSLISKTKIPAQYAVMSLSDVQKKCHKQKAETICNLTVPNTVSAIQLPIYYYNNMLKIMADGKEVRYYRTLYRNNILTAIKLQPGQHIITMQFVGLRWANWMSLFAWIGVFCSVVFLCI